jgi:hypothetical protein
VNIQNIRWENLYDYGGNNNTQKAITVAMPTEEMGKATKNY